MSGKGKKRTFEEVDQDDYFPATMEEFEEWIPSVPPAQRRRIGMDAGLVTAATIPQPSEEDEFWLKQYPLDAYRHLSDAFTTSEGESATARRYPERGRLSYALARDVGTDMPRERGKPAGTLLPEGMYIAPAPTLEQIIAFQETPYHPSLGIPNVTYKTRVMTARVRPEPPPAPLSQRVLASLREGASTAASRIRSYPIELLRAAYERPADLPTMLLTKYRSMPKEGKGRRRPRHARY